MDLFLNNTLQQYIYVNAYHFFFVLQFFSASSCSCLAPLTVSFHMIFLYSSHALRFLYILLFSQFLLCPTSVIHLYISSYTVHTLHVISYSSTHFTEKTGTPLCHNIFLTVQLMIHYNSNLKTPKNNISNAQ
jgi:hypothetical protein